MMKKFLLQLVVIEMIVFVGAAAFVLSSGQFDRVSYSNALFLAGAAMMGFGAVSWVGTSRYYGDPTARYIETVSHERLEQRSLRLFDERMQLLGIPTKMFLFGLIPVIGALLVGSQ